MKLYLHRFVILVSLLILLPIACDSDDDDPADGGTDDDQVDDDATDDDAADDDVADDDQADDDIVDPFLNPESFGPFQAGTTTFFFEDTSRELSCGAGNRILMTEVWYPAVDNAEDWPENWVSDYFLGRDDEVEEALQDMGIDPDAMLIDQPTGSYRDAPLHPDAPPMPVLLFSHGFSSSRFQNYTMAAYLASHGYMVVAPDHICNSQATLTPDGVVLFSILDAPLTLGERKADMSFLIDMFTENPPEMFAGRIDNARIGFWGHSFGGVTVTEQIKVDRRVSALLQLASFGFPNVPEDITAQSMYLWGKEDKWMHMFEDWHDTVIEKMPAPKFEMEFYDTGHFAFSDLCSFSAPLAAHGNGCGTETRVNSEELFTNPTPEQMNAVMGPLAVAFFGAALFGYEELYEYLAENHWPERADYFPVME